MSPSASSASPFELQASDEAARRGLLYADKQLLKAKQYRELIAGFQVRSERLMLLMGVMAVLHAFFALLYFGGAGASDSAAWQVIGNQLGRPLMCAVFLAMSLVAWRDARRCARILASEEDEPA